MTTSRRIWVGVAAVLAVVVVLSGRDEPPRAAPTPQVDVSVKLDKWVYTRGETVLATVTVTNRGRVPAERIGLDCGADAVPDGMVTTNHLAAGADWVGLHAGGMTPIDLDPLAFRTFRMSGTVPPEAEDVGTLGVLCAVSGSAGLLPLSQAEAAVTGAGNAVTGRFTVCRIDEGGRYTTDLGAAGVRLTLERGHDASGEPRSGSWSTVTDADGRFAFPAVAAGPYWLTFEAPPGHVPNTMPHNEPVDLLVTGTGLRWSTSELTVTPTDPATSCAQRHP